MGPASISMTLFASRIRDPVEVDRSGRFEMVNAPQPTTSRGAEIIGAVRLPRLSLTATYTYVRAREAEGEGRSEVPLTPTHSAGVVAMLEDAGSGRLGVEAFYTGGQRLEENPYRQRSVPYVSIGVLGERRIGSRLRLFVNAENITGTRQTRWDPQLRPERGSDGRWTVDAWAPLEGRVINGGVRVLF
jgi:iron complex outermembrane receptor protein